MSSIFVLINLALLPVFILVLKRFHIWLSIFFLVIVTLEGVFVAFDILIFFYRSFGTGLLSIISAIFIPVIFLAWVIQGVRLFPQLNNQRKVIYVIGGILILFAQSSPLIGTEGIGDYCDESKKKFGDTIVITIQQYHKDKYTYPAKIESLIPVYLSGRPTHNCMQPLGLMHDAFVARYEIMECEGKPSLVTYSTVGARDIWYDFELGKWSSISSLDSSCE